MEAYKKPINYDIEGDFNVKLAPVKGRDDRREIDRLLFKKRPAQFLAKFSLAMIVIAVSWALIFLDISLLSTIVSMVICGLMYAHLIELQHECLHNHAFNSSKLNRVFGVLSGVFMLVSHSHYRYDHLRHHAYLGTDQNLEHFNYRFQGLNSILGFGKAFFDLSRYKTVFRIFMNALLGQDVEGVEKAGYARKIKQEYVLYVSLVFVCLVLSIYFKTWFFALAWWIPALLVSEGTHFMIEMPEHFGLDSQTDPNVLSNTRTIKTNAFFSWFVNGNDLHTAHHYHQGIPMCNLHHLQKIVKDKTDEKCVEESYFKFYQKVVRGDVTQTKGQTVMTR